MKRPERETLTAAAAQATDRARREGRRIYVFVNGPVVFVRPLFGRDKGDADWNTGQPIGSYTHGYSDGETYIRI